MTKDLGVRFDQSSSSKLKGFWALVNRPIFFLHEDF
jgi:hypothetical protein